MTQNPTNTDVKPYFHSQILLYRRFIYTFFIRLCFSHMLAGRLDYLRLCELLSDGTVPNKTYYP